MDLLEAAIDRLSDQWALPHLLTTIKMLSLTLYASFMRDTSAFFREACGMLVYKLEISKLSTCTAEEK